MAILVRLAPGFGVDEGELNTRLREDSVQALRQSHSNERNSFKFFNKYSAGVANPVRLAPLLLVLVVVSCFQLLIPQEDFVS